MPVNNSYFKKYQANLTQLTKLTNLTTSNNLLVIILGALVALTSSVNNQESQVTKNPIEQVKLEFQMLRAKQNLISPNLTEKITLTAKNSPTLYREISKIAQAFKILTPEITISELESQKTAYKDWVIQYDSAYNKLTIGKNLLDQLTMPELRNLIASEIGYDICMAGNSTGMNILKAIPISLTWFFILLAPLIFPNYATKEVLYKIAIVQFSMFAITMLFLLSGNFISFIFAPLFYPLFRILPCIASTYAKSHLELAIDKLPYLPNAELLNSAIDKIETNGKCDYYKVRSKSLIKTWCKHHKIFADALTKKHLERQKLAAQAAAVDELINTNNDLEAITLDAALKQSVPA